MQSKVTESEVKIILHEILFQKIYLYIKIESPVNPAKGSYPHPAGRRWTTQGISFDQGTTHFCQVFPSQLFFFFFFKQDTDFLLLGFFWAVGQQQGSHTSKYAQLCLVTLF